MLRRSLENVVLPKWLQEASALILEAADGDTIYVSSRLDAEQVKAGAEHVGKTFKFIVDPIVCRGGISPAPHQNYIQPPIGRKLKTVPVDKLTYGTGY